MGTALSSRTTKGGEGMSPERCDVTMRTFAVALPYLLHLVPPAAAWAGGSRHLLWFASSLFVATAIVGLWRTGDLGKRVAASVLNLAVSLANVALAISFLVQGVGFNLAFFAHANSETLALVLANPALRTMLLAMLGYLVMTLACPFLLGKAGRSRVSKWGFWAAGAAGIALNTPAWSFAWHVGGIVADAKSALWVPKPVVQLPALRPDRVRSLVLIFVESLEATYSRVDLFGEDLTPRLTALAASGKQFTDMRQVPQAAWTTAALVAAQCARPLSANAWLLQQATRGVSAEMEGATCLGDVLAAHNYRTVLMTAISTHFGGVETFHAAHGSVERLGFEALSSSASKSAEAQENENRHWLIEDDVLLALARTKIGELAAEDAPFALVVTTMDTHGPSGFPSASCGAARGMVATVRCADRLISEFIEDVRSAHPDVVVALSTDHFAGTSGIDEEVVSALAPRADERRLRFVVWGPDVTPEVIDHPGTHFDIMPTLMDFLGLRTWTEHYLGVSLLRFESPWLSHDRPLSLRVAHELPPWRLHLGDEVRFEPQGPVIDLAGRRVLATSKGLHLRDAVFAIRLDDAGAVVGFRTFGDTAGEVVLREFAQWATGHVVVGVSTDQIFNSFHRSTPDIESLSKDAVDTAFFAGAFDKGRFVTGPLVTPKVTALLTGAEALPFKEQ